jgi:phosphoenolpyruvate-protein kinase (PTS system EI component)
LNLATSPSTSVTFSFLSNVKSADKAAIFDAHLLVLDDPELIQPIQDKIKNENANAATALYVITHV